MTEVKHPVTMTHHYQVYGRDAPKELIEAGDLVTQMTEVKHPFQAGIRAQ